jgi:uncharacterized membrane protein
MKKSVEIPFHALLWIIFASLTLVQAKLFLEHVPDASFASHLSYVVVLDICIGLIFFYTTWFALPWAGRTAANQTILIILLLFLLIVFAFPAMEIGILQVLSSVLPHIALIFLAIVFRKLFVVK